MSRTGLAKGGEATVSCRGKSEGRDGTGAGTAGPAVREPVRAREARREAGGDGGQRGAGGAGGGGARGGALGGGGGLRDGAGASPAQARHGGGDGVGDGVGAGAGTEGAPASWTKAERGGRRLAGDPPGEDGRLEPGGDRTVDGPAAGLGQVAGRSREAAARDGARAGAAWRDRRRRGVGAAAGSLSVEPAGQRAARGRDRRQGADSATGERRGRGLASSRRRGTRATPGESSALRESAAGATRPTGAAAAGSGAAGLEPAAGSGDGRGRRGESPPGPRDLEGGARRSGTNDGPGRRRECFITGSVRRFWSCRPRG